MSRMFPACPKPAGNHPWGCSPAGTHPGGASRGDLRGTVAQPPLSDGLQEGRGPGSGDEEGVGLGTALLCCISTRGCEQPPNGGRRRAGRCQMQMRCSKKDAESMDSMGKAWLDKSFLVLLH